MIKKIYLIRHGETDLNKMGILQGSGVDTALNETGKKQSLLFFEAYKHIPFDKIYTSKLKRSIQSIELFLKSNIPHEAYAELNEISFGTREKLTNPTPNDPHYLNLLADWNHGHTNSKLEGGESPEEVQQRLRKVIEIIKSRKDEKNILISMHGRAIRILLCTLFNYDLKYMDIFQHQNLSLYQLTSTGSMFSLDLYNDRNHLAENKLFIN